jgi:hypothetical protein
MDDRAFVKYASANVSKDHETHKQSLRGGLADRSLRWPHVTGPEGYGKEIVNRIIEVEVWFEAKGEPPLLRK